jgi:hypothetical protein
MSRLTNIFLSLVLSENGEEEVVHDDEDNAAISLLLNLEAA